MELKIKKAWESDSNESAEISYQNQTTRKEKIMNEKIKNLKSELETLLADAPEEGEGTYAEDDMYNNMQNLKESINTFLEEQEA